MFISKECWCRLKQELAPILFLFILGAWLNFNFPVFRRLGSPWNIIASIIVTILCTIVHIFNFMFPERVAPYCTPDYLAGEPEIFRTISRNIPRVIMRLASALATLYCWYYNIWHTATVYYVLSYVYLYAMWELIERSAGRVENIE